jgi:transposase
MAISLPDTRSLSDEVLEALRLRALRGCEMGLAHTHVAEMLGVRAETVSRWWAAYNSQGLDAVPHERTGRPLGSGRTLTDEQATHIQQLIDSKSPDELGIAAPLWSRRAVRDLIDKEFGIWMPVRTVGDYLHRWGYTAKRPRRLANDQDPEEVRTWLEETYPLIEAQAKQEDADIFWCDETGVAADEYPRLGYAREGQRATMKVPKQHIRINMISAINNEGELRFMTYKETMDGALFIDFLRRLLRTTSRKILLIGDYLSAHDSAEVDNWLEDHQDQIELFFSPHRSPELNPDEFLNNDLKGNVHEQGLPNSKKELRSRVQRFMRTLYHWGARVASYFEPPSVQYAAAP